jgi:iron complex transport system permease protein
LQDAGYRWTPVLLGATLALAMLALLLCGLAAGSTGWSLGDGSTVIWEIRAPRTVGSFLVGALLGQSGAIAQGVFRNPLAEPYLLGSASGATLAIVLVLAAGHLAGVSISVAAAMWRTRLGLVSAAFIGALGGIGLTVALARGAARPTVLLLAGVVVGVVLGALANLMMLVSPEALRGAQVFLLGNTGFLGWRSVAPLALALMPTLAVAARSGRALDALVLGESTAISLGVPVARIRLLLICTLAICTGTAVAESGLIAFVGLVAPHIVRRSVVVNHAGLIMISALAGGVLLLAADVVARTVLAPQELPVGLLTAIVGGGYLLLLLHRGTRAVIE